MQEQIVQTKVQKWMKNASQQKMNKITESKKYIKETEKKTSINADEFMIELDLIDQKQERQNKVPKGSNSKINKKNQNKNKEKFFFQDIIKENDKNKKINHKISDQVQEKECEEEIYQEEQKQEKENQQMKSDSWIQKGKKDGQDLSKIQQQSKVLIIEDDSDEKYTENTNPIIQTKINESQNNKDISQIQKKEKKEGQNDKTEQFLGVKQGNILEEQLIQKLEYQHKQYDSQLLKLNQQKHPKIQIQQNVNHKQHKKIPVMIVDAFMQTDDTSDINGQEILNLILLEQNTVYQLNQLHEKILRLLNNQI